MFKNKLSDDIELRLLEIRDAEKLYGLVDKNREHLREWLPWVDSTNGVADTKEFISFTLKQFAENDGFQAGIWYQDELAGVIGYHSIDWANSRTSIGYWLGEDFQGKGIMTLACQEFVKYAFEELHINRVEINCATENRKSRAIPERLGFKTEGTIRQREWLNDHYVDHIVYGMLKSEWNNRSLPLDQVN